MKYGDLVGTWFVGEFQEYSWRCFCEAPQTNNFDDSTSTRYDIKFLASNKNGVDLNLSNIKSYTGYSLNYLLVDIRSFIRLEFIDAFNTFVGQYMKLNNNPQDENSP